MPVLESSPINYGGGEIPTQYLEWEKIFSSFSDLLLKDSLEYFKHYGSFDEVDEESRVAFTLEQGKPYWELIKQDEELQDIFTGFPPELIVRAMSSCDLYLELGRQSPERLDRLLRNQTAHIISADTVYPVNNITPATKRLEGEALARHINHPDTPEKGKQALVANIIQSSSIVPPEINDNIEHYAPYVIKPLIGYYNRMGGGSANMSPRVLHLTRRLKLINLEDGKISTILQEISEQWKANNPYNTGRGSAGTFKAFFEHDDYVAGNDQTMNALKQVMGTEEVPINAYLQAKKIVEAQTTDSPDVDTKTAVQMLQDRYTDLGKKIIQSADSPEDIMAAITNSELDIELARNILRWDKQSQWGESSSESFQKYLIELSAMFPELLVSRYNSSELIKVSRSESVQHELTQDMYERAEALFAADTQAAENLEIAFSANPIEIEDYYKAILFAEAHQPTINVIKDKLAKLLQNAQLNNLESGPEQKLIAFQVDKLSELRQFDFTTFPRGIADLARYKNHINHELLTLLLGCTGEVIPIFSHEDWEEHKTKKTITELTEAVRHEIISQILETDPDLSKRDQQAIKQLMSTKAFNPLFEKKKTGKSLEMQFVPVRGMLLEASGHIANTCWAENTNITGEHPNIDGLIFIQKGEGQGENAVKENFAGAALLIRTTDTRTGTPLLIIRGLNPSQSLLTKVDVEDFYRKLTDYVKAIAEEDGRTAAIVIDDHAGGSASNRPQMFDFLQTIRPKLKNATVHDEDTNFNGYDITQHVYLLPTNN